ncbi:polygalacturonase 6 [Diplocarpon rosae]|nr:polygalacturonase 6 [Diplocarpon rosae]
MRSTLFSVLLTALSVSPVVARKSAYATSSECVVTEYKELAPAVANCTNIVLQDLYLPSNKTLDLSKLLQSSVVTFAGRTKFGFTNSSAFIPIRFGGKNITITSEPGAIIDGNGPAYWDGLGSNGGVPKPNSFLKVNKLNDSVIENLHIVEYPVHGFSISSSDSLIIRNITMDNRAGDAPNYRSGTKPAAHNSDGFDVGALNQNVLIDNIRVFNQDDCVAVTGGNNITINNAYCVGGHGLSIGSIGGKSDNNLTNVVFKNSSVINSTMGVRIKTNYNTTGYVSNVTYSNIAMTNTSTYGIDVQQDYLNGGPVGNATNGVIIENVLWQNVTGTVTPEANNYYILCGDGSCRNFVFEDVKVVGSANASMCNYPSTGCPS